MGLVPCTPSQGGGPHPTPPHHSESSPAGWLVLFPTTDVSFGIPESHNDFFIFYISPTVFNCFSFSSQHTTLKMFILFALLPLAANAVCNSRTLPDCSKCGVGLISQNNSYFSPCKFSGAGCFFFFFSFHRLCSLKVRTLVVF